MSGTPPSTSPMATPHAVVGIPGSPSSSATSSASTSPSGPFKTWTDFFVKCGIPEKEGEITPLLRARGIDLHMLKSVSEAQLKDAGVKLGPIIKMVRVLDALRAGTL